MSSKKNTPRTNVHIYPSVFKHESRILRETRSIVEAGLADRIIILATYEEGFEREEHLDDQRKVIRIPLYFSRFGKNLLTETLMYFEVLLRSVWMLRRERVTHINPHSLSVLPTAVMFRLFKRSVVIYDAHELETERFGLAGARKAVSKFMERALMPFVSKIIVVGPSIADWYRDHYPGKPVYVIRNVPDFTVERSENRSVLRDKVGARDDEILLLYQGIFTKGRAIEMLLEALSRTRNPQLRGVFMGAGPLATAVERAAAENANVSLVPAVPPAEVLAHSVGADVGICAIENICLSYYLSLPNKLFEYIAAGLPLVVFPSPDQQDIVEACENGWVVDENVGALVEFLDSLGPEELETRQRNAIASMQRFAWSQDASQYAEIYA